MSLHRTYVMRPGHFTGKVPSKRIYAIMSAGGVIQVPGRAFFFLI